MDSLYLTDCRAARGVGVRLWSGLTHNSSWLEDHDFREEPKLVEGSRRADFIWSIAVFYSVAEGSAGESLCDLSGRVGAAHDPRSIFGLADWLDLCVMPIV